MLTSFVPQEEYDRDLALARQDMPIAACTGIARWKQPAVRAVLSAMGGIRPRFSKFASRAVAIAKDKRGAVGVWPSRAPKTLAMLAEDAGTPLVQIEDGFLRSNGLGAECRPPLSIVVDRSGIYFDPRTPSDLEQLLTEWRFDEALLARTEELVNTIVSRGVTKYNLGAIAKELPLPLNRRIILVAGQVEDDLSLLLGGAGITNNLSLLRRTRAFEPDAYILYKPHPDVEAGHRCGRYSDAQLRQFADAVIRDHPLPALLARVDAVHVLTSLTGFEALLRGCEIVVHGQPFYAGWGLTRDLAPPPRRGRRLTVMELAAAALILYPRYLDPIGGLPCSAEIAVERLAAGAGHGAGALPVLRRLQGWMHKAVLASTQVAW